VLFASLRTVLVDELNLKIRRKEVAAGGGGLVGNAGRFAAENVAGLRVIRYWRSAIMLTLPRCWGWGYRPVVLLPVRALTGLKSAKKSRRSYGRSLARNVPSAGLLA